MEDGDLPRRLAAPADEVGLEPVDIAIRSIRPRTHIADAGCCVIHPCDRTEGRPPVEGPSRDIESTPLAAPGCYQLGAMDQLQAVIDERCHRDPVELVLPFASHSHRWIGPEDHLRLHEALIE